MNNESQPMKRFYVVRTNDETGISRTGRVIEGVLTQAGKVILEWRPPYSTIGIYNSFDEFKHIHIDCHPSCNEIVFLDTKESRQCLIDNCVKERSHDGLHKDSTGKFI